MSLLLNRGRLQRFRGDSGRERREGADPDADRYRRLAENLTDVIVESDLSGVVTYVSPTCRSVLGVDPADLVGRPALDWVHEDDRDRVDGEHTAILTSEQPVTSTYRCWRSDGTLAWVESVARQVRDPSTNEITAVLGCCRDVTEHRSVERRLHASEARLADAQTVARIGSWEWDVVADTITWSDELYRIFGLEPGSFDATYGAWLEHIHPEDRALADEAVKAAFADQKPFLFHHRLVLPNGEMRVIQGRGRVLTDSDGEVVRMVGTGQDVTEQRRALEALESSEKRYRLLAENSIDLIVVLGLDGEVTYASPATGTVLGYGPDELAGRDVNDLIHADDRAALIEGEAALLAGSGPVTSVPFRVLNRDGNWKWLEATARALRDDGGRFVEIQASAREVGARVLAEQRLAAVRAELERSNLELEQFAFDASHDLTEPLRVMSRAAAWLCDNSCECMGEGGRQMAVSIVDGSERIQLLIADLLEYSLVRTEPPVRERVDCAEMVQQAVDLLADTIAEKHASVTGDGLPVLEAHPTQLGNVFQNLISNALKFTADGEAPAVAISASRDDGAWLFSVADHGIGIDPAHSERVFEVFRRLRTRDSYAGTGIGLSLCRRIVADHGGRIWVESQPDGGSVFRFTIPDAAGEAA